MDEPKPRSPRASGAVPTQPRGIEQIIKAAVDRGASDLHIKAGDVFRARIDGKLVPLTKQRLTPEQTRAIALRLMPNEEDRGRLDKLHEYDCSWGVPGVGRFRVNILRQRSSFMIVMRVIPFDIPTFESLKLPSVLATIAAAERGMILVAGITGSGKSSTMAAILNHINQTNQKHVVTLENPIEFLHRDINSSITQREIGVDTNDFQAGLRAALRQDPDVILIGEMRDLETVDTAMKAAETGHLVISTLPTPDAVTTVSRVLAMFPPEEQEIARLRLAETLQAVVAQRLLPRADGHGRAAAVEVLICTAAARDIIRDPGRAAELHDYIREASEQYGMQTFDQHLMDLVGEEVITYETALAAATKPADFELQMRTLRRRPRAGHARRVLSRRGGREPGPGPRLQHSQVHALGTRRGPAAAARDPREHPGREGLLGRREEPGGLSGRGAALDRARGLGLAVVRRPRARVRRRCAGGGVLRRPALCRHLRRFPRGGPGPRRSAAGTARPLGQGDRRPARPCRREGRDGRRRTVRRAGAGTPRVARSCRPGARGAPCVRVTDLRALLEEISVARLVGTPNHARVREILKRELGARGFVVLEQRFRSRPRAPLWGRAASDAVNLIAVRPRARVTAWLTAHYDSKGQPVSMAARLVLAGVVVAGVLGALAARVAGGPTLVLALPVPLVALFVALSRVSDDSPGAVDNGSGVVTGLATVGVAAVAHAVATALQGGNERVDVTRCLV